VVRRAGRQDVAAIAALLKEAVPPQGPAAEADVLEWLFSKGLVVATEADVLLGVAAWQAENLVAVTDVLALLKHQAQKMNVTFEFQPKSMPMLSDVITSVAAPSSSTIMAFSHTAASASITVESQTTE